MHNQKLLTRCLLFGFIWVFVFLAATFLFFSETRVSMPTESTFPLESNIYERESDQQRILSITLPEEFDEPLSLLFKTTHTAVEVTTGRKSVYSFGHEGMPSFMSSPGAIWHIVDIPADSAGESLAIYISTVYEDYYGNDPIIRYGTREGCAMELLTACLSY